MKITGLSEIADQFDGFLIDQFGVLHNGGTAFAAARDCMQQLAERQAPLVLLTNSGKRAAPNEQRLSALGFPRNWYQGLISSGDLAHRLLRQRYPEACPKVCVLARGNIDSMFEGLNVVRVSATGAPDLLILAGIEPEKMSQDDYKTLLQPLAVAGVPAICVNPDLIMYTADGPSFGCGQVAQDYSDAGGDVEWFGKPAPEIFQAGLSELGITDPARALMVGDSPHHDIAGAQSVGIRTLFVSSGIQSGADGAQADFVIDQLRW